MHRSKDCTVRSTLMCVGCVDVWMRGATVWAYSTCIWSTKIFTVFHLMCSGSFAHISIQLRTKQFGNQLEIRYLHILIVQVYGLIVCTLYMHS